MRLAHIYIYIDGGVDKTNNVGTWGMVVLAHDSNEVFAICGCCGGQVAYDPSDPAYCGAMSVDSFCVEVVAQLFCRMYETGC